MRAKVIFFDSNPIGRILTRFSKEMALLDMVFPVLLTLTSYGMFRVISATISLAIVNFWLFIPVFFLCIYFILVAKSASIAMIEASRLDSVVRGPIHNLFAMTINGLTSIRAYRQIDYFSQQFMNENELSANVTFTYIIIGRWLGFRIVMGILLLSVIASSCCVGLKGSVETALLAFSLQVITDFAQYFGISVKNLCEMQNFMTAVQHMQGYTKLEKEDDFEKKADKKILEEAQSSTGQLVDGRKAWPSKGMLEFKNVTMAYRPMLEPSIWDLSFTVQPGMKIGIVGRTGSGKSSILQVLFRLVDIRLGTVKIDGVEIRDIGLHLLRQSIAFIPQSPFLMQGTIRENLDPFCKLTDEKIWESLREVQLDETIKNMKE